MSDLLLYTVRKRCRECGTEWDGASFQPPASKPRSGICAPCIARSEARLAQLTTRIPAEGAPVELATPVRVAEEWDEPRAPSGLESVGQILQQRGLVQ